MTGDTRYMTDVFSPAGGTLKSIKGVQIYSYRVYVLKVTVKITPKIGYLPSSGPTLMTDHPLVFVSDNVHNGNGLYSPTPVQDAAACGGKIPGETGAGSTRPAASNRWKHAAGGRPSKAVGETS